MRYTIEQWNERRARRQAYYQNKAAELTQAGEASLATARERASFIPFGQPILVGHHSEKRDRRYRAGIEIRYRKGFELLNKAKDLAARAVTIQNNDAISQDDPQALDLIAAKIERLKDAQALYKKVNAAHAKFLKDPATLDKSDLSDQLKNEIRNYVPEFSWLKHPVAPYRLTNLGAEIRRLEKRQAQLKQKENDVTQEFEVCGFRVVDNVEDNRLQIFFGFKPEAPVREDLKRHGFRFSPSAGDAWQCYRNRHAAAIARQIIEKHFSPKAE